MHTFLKWIFAEHIQLWNQGLILSAMEYGVIGVDFTVSHFLSILWY